ncbi:unnamed protein product [Bemisia tabaci]|uniref:Insulin receptor substrate 1 n=1 Tax=Bemisia tabaci TaxID=7038 RepID=A0A9P0EZP5_BEMTA|nr:PREDICTED: docking protein 2 isoform X2 [Bemisia tabaci]CAH0382635.1 unnamed protein product [Bemisia tabaci]
MSMGNESPFKEGYLLLPPHGVLSQLKKSWQKKYCLLFKSSKYGIERLELFDSKEDVVSKVSSAPIITLENCIKITRDAQKHQPHVFVLVTKVSIHHFAANSEDEMDEWLSAFQAVAFKDNVSRQTVEEDNDLYCSSGDVGVFEVRLSKSDASVRCGLEPGSYTLVVAPSALQLRSLKDQTLLFTWPYRFIRRYGMHAGKITFEAGRMCDSGEGVFYFEYSHQQEIFRCLSLKMKSMKKLLNGESSSIICGENQFQAALSMMARSRSPLPPSSASTTSLLDSDACSIPSIKSLMPIKNPPPPPPLKPKPKKPPRKHILPKPSILSENKSSINVAVDAGKDFNDTQNYDDIEVRNEAWKTLGIDTMTHSENPFISDVTNSSSQLSDMSQTELPKVFIKPNANIAHDDYNTLQHFGPTLKMNVSGYEQLNKFSSGSVLGSVRDDDMQACRLADDSHYGYGIIRKKTSNIKKYDVCNDLEYAVVHKPNRV